jgi:hypothetical protein
VRRAPQQRGVDPGRRANDQGIGIEQIVPADGAAVHENEFGMSAKGGPGATDVLVDNDFQMAQNPAA